MINPFKKYNDFLASEEYKHMDKKERFIKASLLAPNEQDIKAYEQMKEEAQKIRHNLINSEGIENRNKMRRQYQNILFLDDMELIERYSNDKLPITG
jgi:oxalate decarboxylase/phosphoglucose isomerase-like protein (cupin superfamily)